MIEDSDRVVRFMKKRKEAVVGFNLEVNAMERRNAGYRVRARDARIRVMRRTLLIATCKNKAAQQRTIAIITQYFSKVFCRYRQLTLVKQTTYIELQCDRCRSCKCEEVEEALQA